MRVSAATLGVAATVIVAASSLIGVVMRPDDTAGPCVRVTGPVMLPEIPESSGLAVSRRDPRLLWSHNDSGNDTILFALEVDGSVRARVRVPIRTIDWEDISAAPCPPNDCVAFIVTRDRIGTIYRSSLDGSRDLTFRPIGELGLGAVTDAETSRDGNFVVVRTSHEAVLYTTADLIRGHTTPYLRIPLDGLKESQGEGVALDGRLLYLSSEGRPWNRAGRLPALRCTISPWGL